MTSSIFEGCDPNNGLPDYVLGVVDVFVAFFVFAASACDCSLFAFWFACWLFAVIVVYCCMWMLCVVVACLFV